MFVVLLAGLVVLGLVVRWFVDPIVETGAKAGRVKLTATFVDPHRGNEQVTFPNLFENEQGEVYLSLVVPAYNESLRIGAMLNETLPYLQQRQRSDQSFTFEIVVVDDGSRDNTSEIVMQFVQKNSVDVIRLLTFEKNRGKGAAVQQGAMHARGRYILMVDADGATRISDLEQLEARLDRLQEQGFGVVVGSRAHLQANAVAERKWYRNVLMYGFHFAVALFAGGHIKDTQCGFKLFTRKAARDLFSNQHLMRWSFDVELLVIARRLQIPVGEVAVNWTEIPGSKLSLIQSSFQMLRDLMLIRLCYSFRVWSIQSWQQRYQEALKIY